MLSSHRAVRLEAERNLSLSRPMSDASNVILGLNPAFPNVVIVEFWERLQDGVNEDRWVEVKLYGRNT